MTTLSQNLKRLRSAAGLTQMALAAAAGLNLSIVAQIEQGANSDPRGSTLLALARALGASVDELLTAPAEEAAHAEAPPTGPKPSGEKGPRRRKKHG